MPYGDGTGPLGTGPIAGGRGTCTPNGAWRRSGGSWCGFGRGFGGASVQRAPVQEEAAIMEETLVLKARLEALEKRLDEMKKGKK